jgi:hypothetical protein
LPEEEISRRGRLEPARTKPTQNTENKQSNARPYKTGTELQENPRTRTSPPRRGPTQRDRVNKGDPERTDTASLSAQTAT